MNFSDERKAEVMRRFLQSVKALGFEAHLWKMDHSKYAGKEFAAALKETEILKGDLMWILIVKE